MSILAHEVAFQGDARLQQYGNSARVLFALMVQCGIEDIDTVASDALTDGPDDKKCDLVYVNLDRKYAVIAQCYESEATGKPCAPENKANDLNTAVSWALNPTVTTPIPLNLRAAFQDLQSALQQRAIDMLELWYVHNLPESSNIERTMNVVADTAKSILGSHYPQGGVVEVHAREVGRATLEQWYQEISTPILVTDEFDLSVQGGFAIAGDNWEAFSTYVPASWLFEQYKKYGTKLFSANIRDYLGSKMSESSINHHILTSAEKEPSRFWAYNNGLTCVVHDFSWKRPNRTIRLKVRGLAIVNGAQTTGAIGSLPEAPSQEARVAVRFVKCSDQATVQEIILYNNSQNRILPSDFRSMDACQRRLRDEFDTLPGVSYLGGRRGNLVSRPQIPSDTAAQALAAFHQDPGLAYQQKSRIWDNDDTYSRFFSEATKAVHVLFAVSLLKGIQRKKRELQDIARNGMLTDSQTTAMDYLQYRGATLLLVAAVAKNLETFLGRQITSSFRISFGPVAVATAIDNWSPILDVAIAFCGLLIEPVKGQLKNNSDVQKAIGTFCSMVDATKLVNASLYEKFAGKCVVE